ncbi:hypothetical protein NP493_239g05012 [Ridgeia piscesae]|uniref:C2H2-type domain-containing protein n=1 Tax=Ridgeia piscesae TaxID=27915 RepID=A0AAD9UDE4_RIDPI|nr:hypothetical protein NP493_239g05012 [Ridgeia piscesae]
MGDFESCRFDFRIDVKKGLTPSKRKKAERRSYSYNTLFKCKVCGNLFDNRPLLLAHKLIHNAYRCSVCQATFPKQSMLKEHIAHSHDGVRGHCQVVHTCGKFPSLWPKSNKLAPLWPKADGDVADVASPHGKTPSIPTSKPPVSTSMPSQFVCINMPVLISPNDWEHDRCPDLLTDVMTHGGAITDVAPRGADAHAPSPMATVKSEPEEILPLPAMAADLSGYRYTGDDDLEPGEIRRGGHNDLFPRFINGNDDMSQAVSPFNMPMKLPVCDPQHPDIRFSDTGHSNGQSQTVAGVKQEPTGDMMSSMSSVTSQDLQWKTTVSNGHVVDISVLPTLADDINSNGTFRSDLCNHSPATNGHGSTPPYPPDSPVDDDHMELNTNLQKHRLRMDVFKCELCSFQGQCARELAHHLCRHRRAPRTDLNEMVERLWKTKMKNPNTETAPVDDTPIDGLKDTESTASSECEHRHEITAEPVVSATVSDIVPAAMSEAVPKKKRRHKQDYCTIKFHTCKFCRQLFDSAEKMWEHVMTHNECRKRGKSSLSNYRYTMLQRLKAVAVAASERESSEDMPGGQDIATCDNRVDSGKFACVYRGCVARYSSHTDLMQHVRCHQLLQSPNTTHESGPNERTFSDVQIVHCDYPGCMKTFRDWRHLKRHRTIHTGEKPLACGLCTYSCRHRSSMNWHMKSKHGLAKTKTNGNRTVYVDGDGNIVDGSTVDHVATKAVAPTTEQCMAKTDSNDIGKEMCSQPITDDDGPIDLSMKTLCSNEPSDILATLLIPPEGADVECSDSVLSEHQVVNTIGHIDTQDSTPDRLLETMHESAGPEFYMSVMKFRHTNPKSQHITPDDGIHSNGSNDGEVSQSAYESKYYTCKLCRQLFETAEQMWEHRISVHEDNQFYCDHCGLETHSKFDLQSHMMATHGKEVGEFKDYLCFVCGKGYSSRTGLNNHLLMHSEDGPPKFICPHPGCVARLHSKGALKNHVRRLHLKIQPRWQCPHDGCSRRFDTTSALRAHQVVHSDDRPLACDFPGCDKSFRESKHLRVHRMQHTDERPLKCHLCDYSCRQRNSMNWHMKSKHQLYKQVTADGRTAYGPAVLLSD